MTQPHPGAQPAVERVFETIAEVLRAEFGNAAREQRRAHYLAHRDPDERPHEPGE